MPRKPTANAAAIAMRELNTKLRREFKYAIDGMASIDKAFLYDVLNLYLSQSPGDQGEIALASAFEGTLKSRCVVVLDAGEYSLLTDRLERAEAFQKKVTMMPERDVA